MACDILLWKDSKRFYGKTCRNETAEVDGRITFEWLLKKQKWRLWIGLTLSGRTALEECCEHNKSWWVHKRNGISRLAEELSASQEGLCQMESVIRVNKWPNSITDKWWRWSKVSHWAELESKKIVRWSHHK